MVFIEELMEILAAGFRGLGEFTNIAEMFTILWENISGVFVGWWEVFSGFFITLFLFLGE